MNGLQSSGSGYTANSGFAMNTSMTNSSSAFLQASSSNSTFQVINQFKFLAARSIRSSAIILSVFNTISAFAAAMGILYDSYQRAKRNSPRGQKVNLFTCVKGAETYPFILSLAITAQGIIFAVSQSRGLDALFVSGCSLISQFMWPAIFIVPYLQLIFGVEMTLRGLRKKPFPPKGKWTTAICLAIWKIILVITGLVPFFIRSSDFCFASLFWFVAKWARGGLVLFVLIAVILVACAIIVFLKLTRHATIETTARVQASRMVYYMAVAILSNFLVTPFFFYLTFNDLNDTDGNTGLTLSMIATVVANVSGLMNGGLHLFFRSNIISTIGPRDKQAEYERQQLKYKIRKAEPSDDDNYSSHAMQPVGASQALKRAGSQEALVSRGDEETLINSPSPQAVEFSPNPLKSNGVFPAAFIPRAPERAQLPPSTSSAGTHQRRPSTSYSLFPNRTNANTTSIAILPPTTYSPVTNNNPFEDLGTTLKPPPSIMGSRHRRDSSLVSSATVQIGLRFSNVDDMPPMASAMVKNAKQVHDLERPPTVRSSPLDTAQSEQEPPSPSEPTSATSFRDPVKDARMKTLPPVPRAPVVSTSPAVDNQEPLLSAAVYRPESPTKKIPSPKGVGFQFPKRANTTPVQDSTPPSRHRGNSDAPSRGEWI